MSSLFYFDNLAKIMTALVIFIGAIVALFSRHYLKGDANYKKFFVLLFLLIVSVIVVISADNIFVFLAAWSLSNFFLVRLMTHKSRWSAAKSSGFLAKKNFLIGLALLTLAFVLLYFSTNQTSIKSIIDSNLKSFEILVALSLILLAAMTQSAIWPFHHWLLSSLNSPTPVSAIMHAGLVNGGGILLVRFAPLYLNFPKLLTLIFVIGFFSAIIATFWKLIQSNIKTMLACSTVSQMGFMLLQCGLGLFSAAIAHLIWHGIFKAYLFLTSPAAAQEKRFDLQYPPSLLSLLLAMFCGLVCAICFAIISDRSLSIISTAEVLIFIAFIAGSQLSLNLLHDNLLKNIAPATILAALSGALYGASIRIVEWQLSGLNLSKPQALNLAHIIGMILFFALWLWRLFASKKTSSSLILKSYVMALNASQPRSNTITSNRNQYN
jgi:NAD(P)H-quinone oxidoreductase subunit 5